MFFVVCFLCCDACFVIRFDLHGEKEVFWCFSFVIRRLRLRAPFFVYAGKHVYIKNRCGCGGEMVTMRTLQSI